MTDPVINIRKRLNAPHAEYQRVDIRDAWRLLDALDKIALAVSEPAEAPEEKGSLEDRVVGAVKELRRELAEARTATNDLATAVRSLTDGGRACCSGAPPAEVGSDGVAHTLGCPLLTARRIREERDHYRSIALGSSKGMDSTEFLVDGVHDALWSAEHRGENVVEMAHRVARERDEARAEAKQIAADLAATLEAFGIEVVPASPLLTRDPSKRVRAMLAAARVAETAPPLWAVKAAVEGYPVHEGCGGEMTSIIDGHGAGLICHDCGERGDLREARVGEIFGEDFVEALEGYWAIENEGKGEKETEGA